MSDAAIAIRSVEKRYGELRALKGVSFEVERGEFFGLLGPNGAGKSTLINIIAGLNRATSGSVAVLGQDVVTQYRESRRHLGVVPQELVFDPFFTVREVLRIQAGYFGLGPIAHDWIERLMDALQLADKADTNMRALSGGMKRRVLIGQALVHKPEVVVLDEPTAGVDVELRQSLWEFVRQLHTEGHTIVLTTHYLEEAETLCDRIAILNHGEVVALDTKERLLAQGIGRRMRVCLNFDGVVESFPPTVRDKVRRVEGNVIELELDRKRDSVLAAIDALRDAGIAITDVNTESADLEDVFVELVQRRDS
jgi:ABC-2 type transport system ATP-binding protein